MAKKAQNKVKKRTYPVKRKVRRKKKVLRIGVRTAVTLITGIVLTLSLCAIWPYISDHSHPDKGSAVPQGPYCYGIDISHYQKDIAWDSLMVLTDASRRTIRSKTKAKDIRPVSFVFIKATEGSSMHDRNFRRHWKDAERHGVRKGAYHFFRSSKSAELQVRNFIMAVGEIEPDDLPPVLDIETIHSGCSHKTLNERALKWLIAVEKHYGRKPVVYSSAYFIKDILSEEIKRNYPIWVAHYETDTPRCDRWNIWQFTDKGVVYGIDGFTDISVCTLDFLRSL